VVSVPGFPTLNVPTLPQQSNNFSSRVQSCIQLGTTLGPALGFGPNNVPSFSAACAN
jgi:hypothetical protein